MGYRALEQMQIKNFADYGIKDAPHIPALPKAARNCGNEALRFLREDCIDLNFDLADEKRAALEDLDGSAAGANKIPFNMERDIDRLCLETAAARFLATGTREDAFDIYFCYCEIFKPFGAGYDSTGLLLKLLSEHETNASSLLMKHRDHYSHSVYVFLIGLSVYRCHEGFRKAYNGKYGLTEEHAAACHFLRCWGMTSLFHDIGYPFEIAHQQMKAYVCALDKNNNDERGFAPYVSYRNMDRFTLSRLGDLNDLYAHVLTDRLGLYIDRIGAERYVAEDKLRRALKDRAIHENPNEFDYLYMDHAYFSGLMLAKTYLDRHREITAYEQFPGEVLDCFSAIILHNSLFKFTFRNMLYTREPLSLKDGQPLCYLLMLCDELQCWDRTSYGQNSRGGIFAFDFDMDFPGKNSMRWTYYFDKAYLDRVTGAKAYKEMLQTGYTKKSGAVRTGRSKFADDIDEIISLKDVIPEFVSDVKKPYASDVILVSTDEEKKKKTGLYLSDSNYLNLYDFALALHARYSGIDGQDETAMKKAFEGGLSLEYKLSNIAQAKGFASQLEKIGCFYTDRAVDYAPVTRFTDADLISIAESEHERWCREKEELGWRYGRAHIDEKKKTADKVMREKTRLHDDLKPFSGLPEIEARKDSEAMEKMLELLKEFGGLTIYRM